MEIKRLFLNKIEKIGLGLFWFGVCRFAFGVFPVLRSYLRVKRTKLQTKITKKTKFSADATLRYVRQSLGKNV
jgi:DNA relaxase NicK